MAIDQVLGIGFLMGLIGSVHCIGMCGPLTMALPFSQQRNVFKYLAMLLYHTGKIFSYASLGLIVGLFGKQIFILDTQQGVSVIIGILMVVYVVWVYLVKLNTRFNPLQFIQVPVLKALNGLFKKKHVFVFLLLGFLNGLLPCGMVYLALGSAMSTGKPIDAALFMALFGLGTMPALLMVAFGGQLIGFAWRRKLQAVLPVFIFGMGLMLILRGLNLGIPMISPHIETNNIVICHN
jgi:sulfite exporter TauE/SafE